MNGNVASFAGGLRRIAEEPRLQHPAMRMTRPVDRGDHRDWQPADPNRGWFSADAATLWLARRLGILPEQAGSAIIERLLAVDGLMSVWQAYPSGSDGPAKGAY